MRTKLRLAIIAAVLVTAFMTPQPVDADTGLRYTVVNADGGVYYRNSARWDDTDRVAGVGVYNGDVVELVCGAWGDPVGPRANRRWHLVTNLSRDVGRGWVPDRMLTTPNAANETTPGEPECPLPPPDSADADTPDGGYEAVFYAPGNGDHVSVRQGLNPIPKRIAMPVPEDVYTMANEGDAHELWTDRASEVDCSTANATAWEDERGADTIDTLAGWSVGRLGPIYYLSHTGAARRDQIDQVILIDPGTLENYRSPCDKATNQSQILYEWLDEREANRLIVLAGDDTADADDATNVNGQRYEHAGIQEALFKKVRGTALAGQVLVCNYSASHTEMFDWYRDQMTWEVAPTVAGCPSGPSGQVGVGWHP